MDRPLTAAERRDPELEELKCVKLALLQMKVDASGTAQAKELNLAKITKLIKRAANQGAAIACLPEMCSVGHDVEEMQRRYGGLAPLSEWIDAAGELSPFLDRCVATAKACGIALVIPVPEVHTVTKYSWEPGQFGNPKHRVYSTAFVFDNKGRLLGKVALPARRHRLVRRSTPPLVRPVPLSRSNTPFPVSVSLASIPFLSDLTLNTLVFSIRKYTLRAAGSTPTRSCWPTVATPTPLSSALHLASGSASGSLSAPTWSTHTSTTTPWPDTRTSAIARRRTWSRQWPASVHSVWYAARPPRTQLGSHRASWQRGVARWVAWSSVG